MARRQPPQLDELSADLRQLLDRLNKEDDFVAILIATSYLDNCLASLLHAFFIKSSVSDNILESGRGLLSTFSAKMDVSYSLGLITKPVYQDLRTISQIRNLLAHSHLKIGFSNKELSNLCEELTYLRLLDRENELSSSKDTEVRKLLDLASSPRQIFNLTFAMVAQHLILIAMGTKRMIPSTAYLKLILGEIDLEGDE